MSHERLRPRYFFDEEKIAQLKQIAPECFEDGKINFETLRQNLGDWAQDEEDPGLEHFGLFWPGKRDARRAAAIPPQGALEPVWGQGLKADGTPDTDGTNDSKNIFIEGENLEVLKLLQKSYAGKVKMIYIDPPYNTGNDFVYDDDFTEPLQEYLRRTGQVDEEGKPMTTNKRSDGRFHSKWLSMMYPRLRLARNLMREDGVIFVSIDDNEVHNLRAIMNEIFGEENFLSNSIWQSRTSISNDQEVSLNHNHTLIFAKNKTTVLFLGLRLDESEYINPDNDSRGPWKLVPIDANKPGGDTLYPIINPKTNQSYLPPNGRSWSINSSDYERLLADGRIKFGMNDDSAPKRKLYLNERLEKGDTKTPSSIILDCGTTKTGTAEIMELFGGKKVFTYPKPVKLINRFLEYCIQDSDIVLDFFAGSCSTGEAVWNYNDTNNKMATFILISLPEVLSDSIPNQKDAFDFCKNNNLPPLLTEVSKERLRRAAKRYKKASFLVYKLQNTAFKKWSNLVDGNLNDLEKQLGMFNENPLMDGFSSIGLFTEILLLEGFPLCSSITPLAEIKTNSIRKVSSEYCEHSLLVCLDEKIAPETVAGLQLKNGDIFICLDSAISNVDKLRLSDKGLIKTI